jgi:hypothetical protein
VVKNELFSDLTSTNITKAKIGNDDYISVKGMGTIAITNCSGITLIPNVLFVLEIQQNSVP